MNVVWREEKGRPEIALLCVAMCHQGERIIIITKWTPGAKTIPKVTPLRPVCLHEGGTWPLAQDLFSLSILLWAGI